MERAALGNRRLPGEGPMLSLPAAIPLAAAVADTAPTVLPSPATSSLSNPAFYPEDDPFITAAGGTHITTNGAGGPWESEIAWGGTNPVQIGRASCRERG